VVLGASNLSLGLQTVLSVSRRAWGADIEVLAAAGYGRSYGAPSRVAFRRLPGILESGLWSELERLPAVKTRAVIADVGNDILYGFGAPQIIAWVEEAARRLLRVTRDIVVTGLPVERLSGLSPATFLFFRSVFFPTSRVLRGDVLDRARQVNDGLSRLASQAAMRLLSPRPEWYGADPIHFRPNSWGRAWTEILTGDAGSPPEGSFSPVEWSLLHTLPPERRWLFGRERVAPQRGRPLRRGGRLWLY
jgi:hypothetical protein